MTANKQNTSKAAKRYALDNERTANGMVAFFECDKAAFIEAHNDVENVDVNTWVDKKGHTRVELVVTSNMCRGRVHVELTVSAMDVERARGGVDAKYIASRDKLIAKERNEFKGCKPARKSGPTKAEIVAENAALREQIAAMHDAMVAAGLIAA